MQFPVCARCTGQLVGALAAVGLCAVYTPPVALLSVLLLPMIADGLIQQLTPYESKNWKRLLTGMLFGYAMMTLFLLSVAAAWRFGYRIGKHFGLE